MKILSTSTDISADDASLALKSVLAPKKVEKVKTTTDAKDATSKEEEEEEEELVNDEETTRGIMDSAIDITNNVMDRWGKNDGTFEISELTLMLEATFAINDEYAAVTKHNAKTYSVPTTDSTDATTTTDAKDATAATDAKGATSATDTTVAKDTTEVKVVSDYEKEKGK